MHLFVSITCSFWIYNTNWCKNPGVYNYSCKLIIDFQAWISLNPLTPIGSPVTHDNWPMNWPNFAASPALLGWPARNRHTAACILRFSHILRWPPEPVVWFMSESRAVANEHEGHKRTLPIISSSFWMTVGVKGLTIIFSLAAIQIICRYIIYNLCNKLILIWIHSELLRIGQLDVLTRFQRNVDILIKELWCDASLNLWWLRPIWYWQHLLKNHDLASNATDPLKIILYSYQS